MQSRHIIGTIAAAVLFTAITGCEKKAATVVPLPVRIETVKSLDGSNGLNYSATIVPESQIDLAFRTDGYIHTITERADATGREHILQPGDKVLKGDEMAQIDPQQYKDRVIQAEAKLAAARADEIKATKTFERATALQASDSITGTDFDSAQRQYSTAQANVANALASLDEAQVRLKETKLIAPFNGTILKRMIEVGSLVHSGTTGFVLADTSKVKAVFGVPDIILKSVKLGSPMSIMTASYPETQFPGIITDIAPSADQRTRVFDITITLDNPDDKLKANMVATLVLETGHIGESFVVVPLSSVVENPENGSFSVFVVKPGKDHPIAVRTDVEAGQVIGNNIVIQRGLNDGDKVITSGATQATNQRPLNVIQ